MNRLNAHSIPGETPPAPADGIVRSGSGRLVRRREIIPAASPLDLYRRAVASFPGETALWRSSDGRRTFLGVGAAARIRLAGPDRFERVEAWRRSLMEEAELDPEGGRLPLLIGAFAFLDRPTEGIWEAFAPAEWMLPAHLFAWEDGRLTVVASGFGGAPPPLGRRLLTEADPVPGGPGPVVAVEGEDRAKWRRMVEDATRAIAAGALEKVVVARTLAVRTSREIDPPTVVASLAEAESRASLFAVGTPGGTFVGASPETLFELEGDAVRVLALAGTRPRGKDPAEDAALARDLASSPKDRAEHALVVRGVRQALSGLGLAVRGASEPEILRNTHLQHLATWVQAAGRTSAAALLGALHPTPALGGAPRGAASRWLADHEGFERGFYGGPVGWMAPNGDAHMTVAIRSALLVGSTAHLFAGCGIVAGSTADAEFAESEAKFRPLLRALGQRG